MKAYIPNDHRVLSWDPENMEQYWQLCKKYDFVADKNAMQTDLMSQKAYCELKQI